MLAESLAREGRRRDLRLRGGAHERGSLRASRRRRRFTLGTAPPASAAWHGGGLRGQTPHRRETARQQSPRGSGVGRRRRARRRRSHGVLPAAVPAGGGRRKALDRGRCSRRVRRGAAELPSGKATVVLGGWLLGACALGLA